MSRKKGRPNFTPTSREIQKRRQGTAEYRHGVKPFELAAPFIAPDGLNSEQRLAWHAGYLDAQTDSKVGHVLDKHLSLIHI